MSADQSILKHLHDLLEMRISLEEVPVEYRPIVIQLSEDIIDFDLDALSVIIDKQFQDGQPIMDHLDDLENFKQELRGLQKRFYSDTYKRSWDDESDQWHIALVKAQNPSYQFLIEDDAFEDLLKKAGQSNQIKEKVREYEKNRVSPLRLRKIYRISSLAIAASVAIMLIWQPFNRTNRTVSNTLLAMQVEVKNAERLNIILGESDPDEPERSPDFINGLSYEQAKGLQNGIQMFRDDQYQEAIDAFKSASISQNQGVSFLIYLAISQLRTGQIDEAGSHLEFLKSNPPKDETLPDEIQPEAINYYLAIYYIKARKNTKARKLLRELSRTDSAYQERSEQALKDLRWF